MKNGTPLSKIISTMKIDPKNARAKLRRLKIPAGILSVEDSWMFTPKGVIWVRSQLKHDHRRIA